MHQSTSSGHTPKGYLSKPHPKRVPLQATPQKGTSPGHTPYLSRSPPWVLTKLFFLCTRRKVTSSSLLLKYSGGRGGRGGEIREREGGGGGGEIREREGGGGRGRDSGEGREGTESKRER